MLLWTLYYMLLAAQESVSEKAQCYQHFDAQLGSCSHLLGEAEVDDCCLNPRFGYKDSDGVCHSCRPAKWTEWGPWGSCTVSCLEGVQQRRRFCYGLGTCKDTQKEGSLETRPCEEKTCCPRQGGWAEWGQWQPCSVTCGTGQKLRERTCSSPPPVCGGSCSGQSREYASCDTGKVCPVHGGWSDWGAWGACDAHCTREGSSPPQRHSFRTCTNPAPSTDPPGLPCPGSEKRSEHCVGLPYCAVHGGWGPWGAYSECSVTCGLGQRERTRACNNPEPRHGGQHCTGDPVSIDMCNTRVHCPVDGEWSEWSEWSECKRAGKDIRCKTYSPGRQSRERVCEHREWNGTHCPGSIQESRPCYDIQGCRLYGNWSDWGPWGLCQPNCGPQAQKTRTRTCVLDYSEYTTLKIGPNKETAHFAGIPLARCPRLDAKEKTRSEPCLNVPPCT
ncbi:properdin-like [Anguilla rostrata]|uniref:properdin-like n=1 Tax=Anguilla rostrata TaxID=7938 RepID=UPI0030D54C79